MRIYSHPVNRRDSLKALSAVTAHALFPSVLAGAAEAAAGLDATGEAWTPRWIRPERAAMLEALVDTILPATDTPGARQARVQVFVDLALRDCYTPAEQQLFVDRPRGARRRVPGPARAALRGLLARRAPRAPRPARCRELRARHGGAGLLHPHPEGPHARGLLHLADRGHPGAGLRGRARRVPRVPGPAARPEGLGHVSEREQQTYDAIVVGSGMTGGWAAKELTEAGLRTLVLERGGPVAHVKDYPTAAPRSLGPSVRQPAHAAGPAGLSRSRASSPSCSART